MKNFFFVSSLRELLQEKIKMSDNITIVADQASIASRVHARRQAERAAKPAPAQPKRRWADMPRPISYLQAMAWIKLHDPVYYKKHIVKH
jgi:hypothetical protein